MVLEKNFSRSRMVAGVRAVVLRVGAQVSEQTRVSPSFGNGKCHMMMMIASRFLSFARLIANYVVQPEMK